LLYLVLGRPIGGPKNRFGKTKIVAPDDDPTFLRDLSEKLDKEKPESKEPENTTDPDEDSGDSASKDKS
jgi:hypothetical protein